MTKKSDSKRSGKKKPNVYTMEQRQAALAKVRELGLSKAASELGIIKQTLYRWCKDSGTPTSTATSKGKAEAAIEASKLANRERFAQARAEVVDNLAEIAVLGTQVELARLKLALEKKGELIMLDGLKDIVGARTRAIHDLELLSGRATDRTEVIDSVDGILDLQRDLQERLG